MATCVLLIGKSGSGKSASLRNCVGNPNWGVINVLGKPLPFRGKINGVATKDYNGIKRLIIKSSAKSLVVDDAGYLITDFFMENHSSGGRGNSIFDLYNTLADQFYELLKFAVNYPDPEKVIYFIMHEDKNDFGDTKPKTIGKLLDEKVCIEGMFSIVLRSAVKNGQYVFETQSDGFSVCKSPIGMFDATEIDNDLLMVDDTIREYFGIALDKGDPEENKAKEE